MKLQKALNIKFYINKKKMLERLSVEGGLVTFEISIDTIMNI